MSKNVTKTYTSQQMFNWQLQEKNGLRTFGPNWTKKVKGIQILYLTGNDYQMGYSHGILLKDEILKGMLSFLPNYIKLILQESFLLNYPHLLKWVEWLLDVFILKRIKKNCAIEDLRTTYGLADALGKSRSHLEKAVLMPDFAQYLAGLFYNRKGYHRINTPMGCSSFAASGQATINQHTLVGHNKDYDGMGFWEPYHTLIFCDPVDGARFVIFSSAGAPYPSLASVNEHGVFITMHTLLTSAISTTGTPILLSANEVIKRAKSVEDAISILEKQKSCCGWKFLIADRSGRAAIVEKTGKTHCAYYMKDEIMGCGNLHEDEAAIPMEINLCPSMMYNFHARQKQMKALLKLNKGKIDIALGTDFLGNHYDPFIEQERSTGNVICQMTNLMSLLVDLTDMHLWIADGSAPANNTTYRGFHFEDGFSGDFSYEVPDYPSKYHNSKMVEGLQYYIQASTAYFIHHDKNHALLNLKQAMDKDSQEIIYPLLSGIVELQLGHYAEGETLLKSCLTLPADYHKINIVHLWIARSLDLQGKKEDAQEYYQWILNQPKDKVDPKLYAAVLKNSKKPYKARKLKYLPLNFWLCDTMEY